MSYNAGRSFQPIENNSRNLRKYLWNGHFSEAKLANGLAMSGLANVKISAKYHSGFWIKKGLAGAHLCWGGGGNVWT
jgi:hypothetical protein